MIIQKESAIPLKRIDFANIPNLSTGFIKEEVDDETGLNLLYFKNPLPSGEESVSSITHSVVAKDGDNILFVASLEGLDLRALSSALGESVKTLQAEYGVKGYNTESRIILYGNGEKEDLGLYLGAKDDESIFDFLRGLFEDSFVDEFSEDEDYSAWLLDDDE